MWAFAFECILAVAAVASVANGHPSYAGKLSREASQIPVNNATAFAITYGYPLALYASSLDSVISVYGVNAIFHETTTASASGAAIVRPNVDTLYSKVAIDLSQADVALTVPTVPDGRFYVLPFYDLWGNNFANMGTLNNTLPGTYLIRAAKSADEVGFEAAEYGSPYLGYINFPTTYGLILPRILLRSNTTADLDAIHAIQSQIKVEEKKRPEAPRFPPLTVELLGNGTLEKIAAMLPSEVPEESIKQLLQVTAKVASYNAPINPKDAPEVDANFEAAGLSDGRYSPPASVNYTVTNMILGSQLIAALGLLESFGNGWEDFPPQYSGNFHNQYSVRSIIAYTGYLQLVQAVTLYPEWDIENNVLTLTANQSYIMTFPSGKPPVDGFWSMTAYNETSYLIDNSLNRYALGDRSNITYADGTPVYGSNSTRNDAFSLLLQPADITPPANWTSNWLPAPSGGGTFTVNLRFYGPTESLFVGGSYVYPVVTKQAAFRN